MKLNLVVGAGFSGAVIANLIATRLNEHVLVIDRRSHIAGNSYDYKDSNGITVHKYGSHIFHTSDKNVWEFVNQFAKFNNYEHKVKVFIDGKYTTIPFNLNSLYDVFEFERAKKLEEKLCSGYKYGEKIPILEFKNLQDEDLKQLAEYIYKKIFLYYTSKQWGVKPEEIENSVTARVPVFISKDERYFQDEFQGIPIGGYSKLIEKILSHKNITLKLNTDFSFYGNDSENISNIFYSGSIDEFFNYKYGVLPYRSVNFELETVEKEYYQDNAVINYPCSEDYTRIHEYKYYLNDKSPNTVIAKEYSTNFELGKNERFYPIPNEQNKRLYDKYIEESKQYKNLYFIGRLGKYKYFNMDETISDTIKLFESEIMKEKK